MGHHPAGDLAAVARDAAAANRVEHGAEATRQAIRAKAHALGFGAVGFAPPDPGDAARRALEEFLAGGLHGDMGWMASRAAQRGDPRRLWPEVRSVIVLAMNYGPTGDPMDMLSRPERGAVSVYAAGRDYHDVIKKKLKLLGRWLHDEYGAEIKVFVDTAPVMEKPLAAAAGLGWQGKHSNLVSRRFGSWLFLAEIFTTLDLPPDPPHADRCGGCRRCLEVCPTRAFPAPYRLDARRCLSYLTIEHKGHIPREFRVPMANRIYGCDDCLAVCPWNKFARRASEAALWPRAELTAPRLADLARLDDASFRRVFAGSPIKRLGRDRFIRNVLIALGNCGNRAQAATVEPHLADPSPLVRAMAVWALLRLLDDAEFAALRALHADTESDPAVRAEWAGS